MREGRIDLGMVSMQPPRPPASPPPAPSPLPSVSEGLRAERLCCGPLPGCLIHIKAPCYYLYHVSPSPARCPPPPPQPATPHSHTYMHVHMGCTHIPSDRHKQSHPNRQSSHIHDLNDLPMSPSAPHSIPVFTSDSSSPSLCLLLICSFLSDLFSIPLFFL